MPQISEVGFSNPRNLPQTSEVIIARRLGQGIIWKIAHAATEWRRPPVSRPEEDNSWCDSEYLSVRKSGSHMEYGYRCVHCRVLLRLAVIGQML